MNRVCFLPERIFILFSCKILFLKNTNFILEITNLLLKRHHFFLLNMLVVCNFYKTEVVWDSGMDLKGFETLLGNYSEQKIEESKISLKPYEAMMLYRKR